MLLVTSHVCCNAYNLLAELVDYFALQLVARPSGRIQESSYDSEMKLSRYIQVINMEFSCVG
jgi:hypothetical protein